MEGLLSTGPTPSSYKTLSVSMNDPFTFVSWRIIPIYHVTSRKVRRIEKVYKYKKNHLARPLSLNEKTTLYKITLCLKTVLLAVT